MYLVVIGWLYVAMMMGVAEATNATGTVLGGLVTFVLYGLLPAGLVAYLLGAPGRRKAIRRREAHEFATELAAQQAAQDATTAAAATSVPPNLDPPNLDPVNSHPPDESRLPAAAAEPSGVAAVREKP